MMYTATKYRNLVAVNPIYSFIYRKIGKTGVTAPSREPGRIQDPQTVNLSGLHPADSSENLRVERMEGSPNVGADAPSGKKPRFLLAGGLLVSKVRSSGSSQPSP